MNTKTIIILTLMAGFTVLMFLSFGNQVGGYMDFVEAEGSYGSAHVVGDWVRDKPANYDRNSNIFTFHMKDEAGNTREVRYANPKPANFEEAEQLVVEGRVEDGAFVAEHILVKCPSKYNDASEIGTAEAMPQ